MFRENLIIKEDVYDIATSNLPWDQIVNKTILITGGGGFMASYLVKTLLAANITNKLNLKIVAVSRSQPEKLLRLYPNLHSNDLRTFSCDLNVSLPEGLPKADIIIHCASQPSPKFRGTDPVGTLKINSMGTLLLLEYAVKFGVEKFLFCSSSEVYGQQLDPNQEISELDYGYLNPTDVWSCYAESKRFGELMCVAYAHQHGLNTLIVRPFHTYGPGISLNDGRLLGDLIADAMANRDLVVKSDGSIRRPFCYISDAIRGFLAVLLKGESGHSYNIANPQAEISIKHLAELISGLFPAKKLVVRYEIPTSTTVFSKSPITRQIPNIAKAKSLGWAPRIDITTGFKRTILFFTQEALKGPSKVEPEV